MSYLGRSNNRRILNVREGLILSIYGGQMSVIWYESIVILSLIVFNVYRSCKTKAVLRKVN